MSKTSFVFLVAAIIGPIRFFCTQAFRSNWLLPSHYEDGQQLHDHDEVIESINMNNNGNWSVVKIRSQKFLSWELSNTSYPPLHLFEEEDLCRCVDPSGIDVVFIGGFQTMHVFEALGEHFLKISEDIRFDKKCESLSSRCMGANIRNISLCTPVNNTSSSLFNILYFENDVEDGGSSYTDLIALIRQQMDKACSLSRHIVFIMGHIHKLSAADFNSYLLESTQVLAVFCICLCFSLCICS